jgi:hypothetical protein
VPCDDGTYEQGYEKVAIYERIGAVTHAARQLSATEWTSKLWQLEDISHDQPSTVAGGTMEAWWHS